MLGTLKKNFEKMSTKQVKLDQFSYKDRSNLLVYGYLRNFVEMNKDFNLPKEIKQIIFIFYLLDIEPEMIFDEESITKEHCCEIINPHKIKMVRGPQGYTHTAAVGDWGSTAKLKYGISAKALISQGVKSISWKVKITAAHSYPNTFYFIGVVSNRTTEFATSAFSNRGIQEILKDAFGISGTSGSMYDPRKPDSNYANSKSDDEYYAWKAGSWVTVKFIVNESRMIFYDYIVSESKIGKYEMILPTVIDDEEITHWYPAVGLRDADDECEIRGIVVE